MKRVLLAQSPRLEWACLAVLVLALLIRFPVHYLLESPFFMDFNVFHFAAQLVTSGQGHDLYTQGYKDGMYFRYAPLWALLWSWLAALPLHPASVLWSGLHVGWLALTLRLSGRILHRLGLPYPFWTGGAVVLLLVRQLMSEFGQGQADLWWGGLIVLFLFWELQPRPWRSSLALALAVMLKLPAAIFLPYLLCTRRAPVALRTLAWLAVLIPLGAVLVSPAGPLPLLVSWGASLTSTSPGQTFMIGDQSLLALLGRFLTADGYALNLLSLSRPAVSVLAFAADLALLSAIVLPRPREAGDSIRFTADVALLMILMVLASPAAWLATYTVLGFPAFLAIAALAGLLCERRPDAWSWVLAGLVGLTSLLTHAKIWKALGLYDWKTETYVYLVFMIPTGVALSLFACLWRWRRLRRAA